MAPPPDGGSPSKPSVLDQAKAVKDVVDLVPWLISVAASIAAFIRGVGGFGQFLIEIAFFGFACYVALFVAVPVLMAILGALEKGTARKTTDAAFVLLVSVFVLGTGALVRFALFAPGLTHNVDAIGSAFGMIVGGAILLAPLLVLWYTKGSRPAQP